MQGIHPVFHLYFLGKQKQDSIVEQQQLEPGYVEIYRKDKWNVKDLLICWRRHHNLEYLVSWKGFGT